MLQDTVYEQTKDSKPGLYAYSGPSCPPSGPALFSTPSYACGARLWLAPGLGTCCAFCPRHRPLSHPFIEVHMRHWVFGTSLPPVGLADCTPLPTAASHSLVVHEPRPVMHFSKPSPPLPKCQLLKDGNSEFPPGQQVKNPTAAAQVTTEEWVQSLAQCNGLKDPALLQL